jgi:outer membrane protein assembly factor BamB
VYFCASGEGRLHAYSTDGGERWQYKVAGEMFGGPAVADDRILIGTESDGLHAVSTDGTKLWTADVGEINHTPTIADKMVYVAGDADGGGDYLAAFDLETGEREWQTESLPTIHGSPTVVDRYLACPTWSGTVFAFERDTGQLYWGAPIDDHTHAQVLSGSAHVVYAAQEGSIVALDPPNGRLWHLSLDYVSGSVALTDGALFVCSSDTCYALAYESPASRKVGRAGSNAGPPSTPTMIPQTNQSGNRTGPPQSRPE